MKFIILQEYPTFKIEKKILLNDQVNNYAFGNFRKFKENKI